MTKDPGRMILDRPFDETIDRVLDSFMREGFIVRTFEGGDLRGHAGTSTPLRYARLDLALAELTPRGCAFEIGMELIDCRLAVFELIGGCTLVTAENVLTNDPLFASFVPKVADCMARSLRTILSGAPANAA